jgi:hypothetical protein
MLKVHSTKLHITHDLTDENDVKYLLTMNGEHTKDEDIDENNLPNLHSSSASTTSSVSCRSSSLCTSNVLRKQQQQQVNRRRAFFHDDIIVNNDNHTTIIDDNQQISTINDETINEENSLTLATNDDNQNNKPFKRKVVSFSTMPFEKKVADGMYQKKFFFRINCYSILNRLANFSI